MSEKHISAYNDQVYTREQDSCDGPIWSTEVTKEGREVCGRNLKMDLEAMSLPPGTRVIIEIPECPECGDSALQDEPGEGEMEWPDCQCGFSWSKWARNRWY